MKGRPVAPPERPSLTLARRGETLLVRSAFPTAWHLVDAGSAGLELSLGLFLATLAPGLQGAALRPYAPLVTAAALLVALHALHRLRRVRPIEMSLDATGITLEAPPALRASLGPRRLAWAEVTSVVPGPGGLALSGPASRLTLPWRHARSQGLLPARLGLPSTQDAVVPAFRFDELDWIRVVIERYRAGDPGAARDLMGLAPEAEPAPAALLEDAVWTLPWLTTGRLRVAVVLAALVLALSLAGPLRT